MRSDEELNPLIYLNLLWVIPILILFFGSFYIVGAGERAVLLTFGNPNMVAYTEGLHFKIPLVQTRVIMSIQTQKYVVEKASAASKDLQTVTTDITLNYYLNSDRVPELYKNIGIHYQDKIITPAVLEVVKASTAGYTAEELITKRPEVKEKIDATLRERLAEYGITVQAVSITNFDFSESFNSAIEAKVTAEQNALAAKNKLEQIKYEAEQKVTSATAEAKALELQKNQVTTQLVELRQIEVQKQAVDKWDGHLPLVTGGSMPFIDLNNLNTLAVSNHS